MCGIVGINSILERATSTLSEKTMPFHPLEHRVIHRMIDNFKNDLKNVSTVACGKASKGLGLNLIIKHIAPYVDFLKEVYDIQAYQVINDFAILMYAGHTYSSHPFFPVLPENLPRGTVV